MYYLLFSSLLVVLIFIPFGSFASDGKKSLINFSSQLIYSTIVLSFIALISNFFVSLNIYINSLLVLISAILIIRNWNFYNNKYFLLFLIITGFLIFMLIAKSNTYRPDAGLYHLPYINILNSEKIIFGLSNLNFRFAHISIMQYLSAISNNFILRDNGIIFSTAIIASATIINFIFQIIKYIQNKNYTLHFYFLLSIVIYIFYKMNRFSEYGNDAPAHFLYFFLLSEILKSFNTITVKELSKLFLISIFIILNKVTLIMSIFLPLIFINKNKMIGLLKNRISYFAVFFFICWIVKNIIISGCIIYPVAKTCFENANWSNVDKVVEVSNENESWAKSWPNFRKKNIKKISQLEYIQNYNWIETWFKNDLKKIITILIPYFFVLL